MFCVVGTFSALSHEMSKLLEVGIWFRNKVRRLLRRKKGSNPKQFSSLCVCILKYITDPRTGEALYENTREIQTNQNIRRFSASIIQIITRQKQMFWTLKTSHSSHLSAHDLKPFHLTCRSCNSYLLFDHTYIFMIFRRIHSKQGP